MTNSGFFYWVRATYFDAKLTPPRPQQAFSGWFSSEAEAWGWATKHYSALPGATFEVIKSRSRQRSVARCEKRTNMLDDGEGNVPDVLRIKFRDQHKKGADQE